MIESSDSVGERFQFGRNWSFFLKNVNDQVIQRAQSSLLDMLELNDLQGKSFADIGSGSGLFSLAARLSGARVYSLDNDPESVECTHELKRRYLPDDEEWTIEQRSLLESNLVETIGQFDVVYSWGVLHHTGDLWKALEHTIQLIEENGLLFIAVYNSQGRPSVRWKRIKQLYNKFPRSFRFLILCPALVRIWGPTTVRDLLRGKPFDTWRTYSQANRGMSPWRDVVDWVGGYPFEVAKPEQVFDVCRRRALELTRLKTCGGGRGCNEYVFQSQVRR